MRKDTNALFVDPSRLAGGGFAEKLNDAIMQVAENILNPNTDPKAARQITIKLNFKPNSRRTMTDTTITVVTKLAPAEAIETQFAMGRNLRTGEIEAAEYDGQVRGQMSMEYSMQENSMRAPEASAEPEAPEEERETEEKRPIDLRTRYRRQETQDGYLYDQATGEIYNTAKANE